AFHLLVDEATGRVDCVPACPDGFTRSGRRCLRQGVPLPVGLAQHPQPITGMEDRPPSYLAPTHLSMQGGTLSLGVPLAGGSQGHPPPGHLLVFARDSHEPGLLPAEDPLGQPMEPVAWPGASLARATAYLELGPLLDAQGAGHFTAFFLQDGSLLARHYECASGPADPLATTCAASISAATQVASPAGGALVRVDARTVGLLHQQAGLLVRVLEDRTLRQVSLALEQLPAGFGPWGQVALATPAGLRASTLGLLLAGDPRAAPPASDPLLADAGLGHAWAPVAVPAGPGRRAEPFLAALGRDIATGRATWQVLHLPDGPGPNGRAAALDATAITLHTLAAGDTPAAEPGFLVAALPAAEFPGLLGLALGRQLHLAVLRCRAILHMACQLHYLAAVELPGPAAGAGGLVALPRAGGLAARLDPAGPGPRQTVALLLAVDAAPGLHRLEITLPACPAGEYLLQEGPGLAECRPCQAAMADCLECTSATECTRCRLPVPGVTGVCADTCPPGLVLDPGPGAATAGECRCHADCARCERLPSTGAYVCVECRAGWALEPGAHPVRCAPCHGSCAECSRPGDAMACTACPPDAVLFPPQGTCQAACPSPGHYLPAGGRVCGACPGGCDACSAADTCDRCAAGRYRDGAGACRPCAGACATCTEEGSCSACRPGLVFLDPDPGVPSLCGSTCPPGEFPGPERCARCDRSCDLCAGGAAHCLVCAEGFRWGAAAPGPGKTGACVPCPAGCASCTDADRCLACAGGLLLTEAGACVSTCPAGTFSNGESCQPCDISCAACADGQPD
ncbi:hypothetical protein H696_06311, partial [Fonticula alba]